MVASSTFIVTLTSNYNIIVMGLDSLEGIKLKKQENN